MEQNLMRYYSELAVSSLLTNQSSQSCRANVGSTFCDPESSDFEEGVLAIRSFVAGTVSSLAGLCVLVLQLDHHNSTADFGENSSKGGPSILMFQGDHPVC